MISDISDMFLYLIMLNLLKKSCALHEIQSSVNDYLCCNGVKCLGPSFTCAQFVDK